MITEESVMNFSLLLVVFCGIKYVFLRLNCCIRYKSNAE